MSNNPSLLTLLNLFCFCDSRTLSSSFYSSVTFLWTSLIWQFNGDYLNDHISRTCTSSQTGGIHQVDTSGLRQVCAVKRVCWIWLGTQQRVTQNLTGKKVREVQDKTMKMSLHEAHWVALMWSNWWDLGQNQQVQCEILENQLVENRQLCWHTPKTFWKSFCLDLHIPPFSTRAGYRLKCSDIVLIQYRSFSALLRGIHTVYIWFSLFFDKRNQIFQMWNVWTQTSVP